eukprot:COSAG01_NODE_3767_length_5718_cov_4.404342_9_plen_119_part_00
MLAQSGWGKGGLIRRSYALAQLTVVGTGVGLQPELYRAARWLHQGWGRSVGRAHNGRHIHHPVEVDVRRPASRAGAIAVVHVRPAARAREGGGIPPSGDGRGRPVGSAVAHILAVACA